MSSSPTSKSKSITINPVTSQEDLTATIQLFKSYATSLGIDLTFQDFSSEMAAMPGKYSADKGGMLLLARRADLPQGGEEEAVVGCVGLRCLESRKSSGMICEMKRLYVDPAGRGLGVGKMLVRAVVEGAGKLGYSAIVLDTLRSMGAARKLYASLGFEEVEAYYETPLREETCFLRLELGDDDEEEEEEEEKRN